ncbi:hypothetical protein CRUP_014332, partial [Coryphaenoides rupestris]
MHCISFTTTTSSVLHLFLFILRFLELHLLAAAAAAGWVCDGVAYPRQAWLSSTLLPRLLRWASDPVASQFKSTLSLLPVEKYGPVYQQLKDKYRAMVKVLWGEERAETGTMDKQSFVDLGCGNGLLVHILSNEGHPGKGIDVRRRKIWDMYGPQTCLEVGPHHRCQGTYCGGE